VRRFSMGLVLPALVTTGALLLAGCGSTSAADPLPTTSPTPSTTTPAVPTLPKAAKQNTKAGAFAFAKHYIDLVNYAQATGDTKVLKAIEAPGCGSCRASRKALESLFGHGGRIVGGSTSIRARVDVIANRAIQGFEVDLIIQAEPETIIRSKGRKHLNGGTFPITLHVATGASGWKLHDITRGA
jgi:hypothetical protein